MEKMNRLFRKSRFGGFNKDDVIDYIERTKNEFFEYKSDVDKTLSELRKKIAELEKENEKLLSEITNNRETERELNVAYPIDGINEATDHLKMVADEICDSLTEFLDKLGDSSFTVSIEGSSEAEPSQAASAEETATEDLNENSDKSESVVSDILDSLFSDNESVCEQKNKNEDLSSVFPSYLIE